LCSFVVLGIGVGVIETSLDFVVDDLLGSLEGRLEAGGETIEALGADSLFFTASLGALELKSSLSGDGSCFSGLSFKFTLSVGVWVKLLQ